MNDRGIQGSVIQGGIKRNKRYPEGRVCAEAECDTPLSIYNGHRTCWAHTDQFDRMVRYYVRGRKAAS